LSAFVFVSHILDTLVRTVADSSKPVELSELFATWSKCVPVDERKALMGEVEPMPPVITSAGIAELASSVAERRGPQPSELNDLIFEGLKWCWRFQGKQVIDVKVVCPICDLDIKPFQENQYCPTLYRCPSCRTELKAYLGTHTELQERFVRHVLKGGY
jgi:hypothetical protein